MLKSISFEIRDELYPELVVWIEMTELFDSSREGLASEFSELKETLINLG